MSGPEHYLEAESLLKRAWAAHLPNRLRWSQRHAELHYLLRAQAHATLALAAATAMGHRSSAGEDRSDLDENTAPAGMHPADFAAWDHVAGVPA